MTSGRLRHPLIGLLAVLAMGAVFVPALAAPLIGHEPLPRVAFVARNDVPFDALGVGPVAGALGGIVVITPSTSLSDPARDALVQFDPDVVYIAGGTAAVSAAAEAGIAAAGDWEVRRLSGEGRDHTAQLIADILADLGVGRPVLTSDQGAQVVGDLAVGGTISADALDLAQPLDADLLAGLEATEFALAESDVVSVPADGTAAQNGSALRAAVAALGPSTAEKETDADFFETVRVVQLGRGVFDLEGTHLDVPRAVVLVGAGRSLTSIRCSCGGGSLGPDAATIALEDDSELRHLSVRNSTTGTQVAVGVHVESGAFTELWDVAVAASTVDGHAQAVRGGASVQDGSRLTAFASGSGAATGVETAGESLQLSRSDIVAFSTSGTGRGILVGSGTGISIRYADILGSHRPIDAVGTGLGPEAIEFSTLRGFGDAHIRLSAGRTYELRHVVLLGTHSLVANGGDIVCYGVVDTTSGAVADGPCATD